MGFILSFVLIKSSHNVRLESKIWPYSISIGLLSGVAIAHYSLTLLRDRIMFKQKWNAYIKAEERK